MSVTNNIFSGSVEAAQKVIDSHQKKYGYYMLMLVIVIIVGLAFLYWSATFLYSAAKVNVQMIEAMTELVVMAKESGLLSKGADSTTNIESGLGDASLSMHIFYSIVAFLSFILFTISGIIKYYLRAMEKAQAYIYGFTRIDNAYRAEFSESNKEILTALVSSPFPPNDAKEFELHAGIEVLQKSVSEISSKLSKIIKK